MMLLSFGVGERPPALVLGRFAQRGDVPDRAERPAVRLRLALTDDQVTLALAEPHGPGAAIVDDCGHEVRVRTTPSTKGSHTRTFPPASPWAKRLIVVNWPELRICGP